MEKKLTIGIVGDGRFASVLRALFLRGNFHIKQSSRKQKEDHKSIFPLTQVLDCDCVFLCIPISAIKQFLKEHAHQINPTALVLDICSVKVAPAQWMQKYVLKSCDMVVTHPVFGPVSSKSGTFFTNLPWMYERLRVQDEIRFSSVLSFLRSQKLRLIEMSCEEHDQMMSRTQLIAFIMGTIGIKMKLSETSLDTTGFKLLIENQKIVESDSSQLFSDMCSYNPFAKEVIDEIQSALDQIKRM